METTGDKHSVPVGEWILRSTAPTHRPSLGRLIAAGFLGKQQLLLCFLQ
jgi:hypothetical protein